MRQCRRAKYRMCYQKGNLIEFSHRALVFSSIFSNGSKFSPTANSIWYIHIKSRLHFMWETWSSRQCPGSPRLPGGWGESHWRMPALPPNTGPCTLFAADCHTCENHTRKVWIIDQTGGYIWLLYTIENIVICLVNLTLGTHVYLFACLLPLFWHYR